MAEGNCSWGSDGMEISENAPFVCLAFNLIDQLFSERDFLSWRYSGKAAMLVWLGSGERGVGCLLLGLNFAEKRRVFAASDDGNGGENESAEVADVKSDTEEGRPVQVSTSMYLGFWHVQSYQIRPNNRSKQVLHEQAAELGDQTPVLHPNVRLKQEQSIYFQRIIAERVLHMRGLGGAGAVAQFMADNPQFIEANDSSRTKPQAWVKKKKWTNKGTEKIISKLMEDNIERESKALFKMHVSVVPITRLQVHSSESSSLKPPEPNAPS